MLPYISLGDRLIPMYGVCMGIGILAASCMAYLRTKRAGGDSNSLIVIAASAVGFGLAGAKLLYIIVSYGLERAFRQALAGDLSFLAEGGQVFYGGLLAGIAGAILGARFTRDDISLYCDAIVPCIPLGHAFGRLGCFFAGCCYGMPYDGIGSVSFPAAGITHTVFPAQLLELLVNLGICAYLVWFTRRKHEKYHVLYHYMAVYGISRFLLEFLRGDLVRGVANGLSTSQWISLGLLIAGFALIAAGRRGRKGQE